MDGKQQQYSDHVHVSLPPPDPFSSRWWSKETVAIVTGANKGIGYSLVRQLAELGLTVVLTARDADKGRIAAESLRDDHRRLVHFHRLDVSDPASIQSFASWFSNQFGVLDVLVNNAAVSFNEIHENSVEHAEMVVNTNFRGPKLLIQALLPFFRRSDTVSRILNISSRLGSINKMRNPSWKKVLESEKVTEREIEEMTMEFLDQVKDGTWKSRGWPEIWTDYAVSKMALNSYSKLLAKRSMGLNLSVNCFCPGFTQTSMTRGQGTHSPDDAALLAATLALLPPRDLPTGIFFLAAAGHFKPRNSIPSKL